MAFWILWVGRTIRSRFVVFALSLGRLRLRCEGIRVCRRLRLLRAVMGLGAVSLLAML